MNLKGQVIRIINLNDLLLRVVIFEISTCTSLEGDSFWISLDTRLNMTLQYRALEMTPSCWAGSTGRKLAKKWILAVGDRALVTSSNFLNNLEIGALAKISYSGRAGWSWWLTSLQFVGPSTHECAKLELASTGINSRSHSVSFNWYFYLNLLWFIGLTVFSRLNGFWQLWWMDSWWWDCP